MSEKKKAAILYLAAAVYLVLFGVITYFLEPILEHGAGTLGPLFQYEQSGEFRYNVVPFINYVRLVHAGYTIQALGLWLLQAVLYLPLGLFLPLLNGWTCTYKRLLLEWVVLSLFFEGASLLTRVGLVNVDNVIFLFLGMSVGYWIWKRWLPTVWRVTC